MKKIIRTFLFVVIIIIFNVQYLIAQPTLVVAYPSDTKVLVQWAKYTNATDYIIEYKASSSSIWIIFPDSINSVPGLTVTGLLNDTSYDFRISAVVNSIPTITSTPVSATPTILFNNNIANQILSTGQSLSVGWTAIPALSTTQPFANKMFDVGFTSLIPLAEPATNANPGVESMSSGMANMLSNLTFGANTQVNSVVAINGVGSAPYTSLKKGTVPYTNGITCMNNARDISNASLIPYRVSAITTLHGETDEMNGVSSNTYEGYLVEWQNDYENDAKAITGQEGVVPLFTDQMATWTSYSHIHPTTALGQFQAAKNNPSKIYLVTPLYIFDYNDHWHLNNYSYRRLGEYFGKVMKIVLVDKQPWLPLSPHCITINGNIITAIFNVPSPPLQFDTTAVLLNTNYGFEYFDSSNSAYITNVNISGPTSLEIVLSNIPTGSNKMLSYAYTGVTGSQPGRLFANSPKGNLCDSDTTSAYYQDVYVPASMGNVLKNWCVTFYEPIKNPDTTSLTVTACNNFTLNNQSYSLSGIYTQVLSNVAGCDCTIILNLTINLIDTSVSQNGAVVTSNATTATYQWVDCDNNFAAIANATNQSFTAPVSGGNYAVIVSQNSCSDTSLCVNVAPSIGIADNSFENSVKVFPNPIEGKIIVSVNQQFEIFSVKLINVTGQIVIENKFHKGNTLELDISNLKNDFYFLEIQHGEKISRIKVVKI